MEFPSYVANDTAETLRRDVVNSLRTVTSVGQAVLLTSVAVATTSTPIAHGLKAKPRAFFVLGQVDARVWRAAVPDASYIYAIANTAVTCDILVIP